MAVLKQWRGLLRAKGLGEENPAWTSGLRDPILPAISYFLTLSEVPGFHEKLDYALSQCSTPATSNQPIRQWASFCAELGATRLLGCELDLQVVGFEEKSPRLRTGSKTCDILADWRGHKIFFEVKRSSKEDSQSVPEGVWEAVKAVAGPLRVEIELDKDARDKSFDVWSLRADVEQYLEQHLGMIERLRREGCRVEHWPLSTSIQGLRITFRETGKDGEGFEPASDNDLCSRVLGPGPPGRDGQPMVPAVQQAANKGADYLLCWVPPWKPLPDLVGRFFMELERTMERTYISSDERLGVLTGIVLFNRFDSFVIVNRESADPRLRLEP